MGTSYQISRDASSTGSRQKVRLVYLFVVNMRIALVLNMEMSR